jgi:hypothetical protein
LELMEEYKIEELSKQLNFHMIPWNIIIASSGGNLFINPLLKFPYKKTRVKIGHDNFLIYERLPVEEVEI